jgi:hypothetical protein
MISVLAALLSGSASARLEPSFKLPRAAWNATDIVVASEALTPGIFRVIESWRGDLTPGAEIRVPQMIKFQRSTNRVGRNESGDQVRVESPIVVLFLKRSELSDKTKLNGWMPAENWAGEQGMQQSFAWLQDRVAFTFVRFWSLGPSVLSAGDSEEKFKSDTVEVVKERDAFDTAVNTLDKAQRATAVAEFVHSRNPWARMDVFKALEVCGPAALPALWGIVNDEETMPVPDVHDQAVRVIGIVGGARAGPKLQLLLRGEVDFWIRIAPNLPNGWWNQVENPHLEILRSHYGIALDAVLALKRAGYKQSAPLIQRLHDLWVSMPQLDDASGLNRLAEECESTLKDFASSTP